MPKTFHLGYALGVLKHPNFWTRRIRNLKLRVISLKKIKLWISLMMKNSQVLFKPGLNFTPKTQLMNFQPIFSNPRRITQITFYKFIYIWASNSRQLTRLEQRILSLSRDARVRKSIQKLNLKHLIQVSSKHWR